MVRRLTGLKANAGCSGVWGCWVLSSGTGCFNRVAFLGFAFGFVTVGTVQPIFITKWRYDLTNIE